MNVYGKIEGEKIMYLALETELDESEIEKHHWCVLGEAEKMEYADVIVGTWLGKPLFDIDGIANYKLSERTGGVEERTEIEKKAELAERPMPLPSEAERLVALEQAMLSMMGGIIDA